MRRVLLLLLAAMMLFTASCGKSETEILENTPEQVDKSEMVQGGIITVSTRKPDTFNPLATNYESCRELFYLFYDGLFTLNEDYTAVPNLASSLEMSSDNLKGRLVLREGIGFADGSSLTAWDVNYTVDFIRQNGGSFSGCIKNIKEITPTGAYSLMIELYSPEANFASMLTFPIIKDKTPYNMDSPNGTGQFRCDKSNIGHTSLLCEKNLSYHKGRPYIDGIKVLYMNTDIKAETSFLSGDTDIILNPEFDKAGDKSYSFKKYEMKSNHFEFLGFNSAGRLFSDESARKAIFAACDRNSLANEFEAVKTVAATPINPAAYFYSEDVEKTELGKVNEILERNGWQMGGNGVYEKEGKNFSFSILVNEDDSDRVGIANFLSRVFLNYGISADVEALPYEKYKERLTKGNYDAFIGGCSIGNAANLRFLLGSGGSANIFGYSGGVMDMRIAALASAEGDNLTAEAKKFGSVIAESAPLAGLYFKTTEVYTKENIVIPKISPTGLYIEAYEWFLV